LNHFGSHAENERVKFFDSCWILG